MTPEQHNFTKLMTRSMRVSGKIFLVFWLLTCSAIAIYALCAFLGVPESVDFSGSSALWIGVLIGSLGSAALGWLFLRFWQRSLDRFSAYLPDTPATESSDHETTLEARAERSRMSTGVHVGLQITLSMLGGLIGFVTFVTVLRNSYASNITSTIVFILVTGAGVVIPRLLICLIPARCPNCSGPTYCRDSRPIKFVCRACGHIHNTGITLGEGDT